MAKSTQSTSDLEARVALLEQVLAHMRTLHPGLFAGGPGEAPATDPGTDPGVVPDISQAPVPDGGGN